MSILMFPYSPLGWIYLGSVAIKKPVEKLYIGHIIFVLVFLCVLVIVFAIKGSVWIPKMAALYG